MIRKQFVTRTARSQVTPQKSLAILQTTISWFASFLLGLALVPSAAGTSSSVTLSAEPNPARYGTQVTLTAVVQPTSATGKVTFYDSGSVVGVANVNSGAAILITSLLQAGRHNLRVFYRGDSDHDAAFSTPIAIGVDTVGGQGFGQIAVPLPFPINFRGLVTGDFNGDGKEDVAALNAAALSPNAIHILLGNGDGTFSQAASYTIAAGGYSSFTAADMNGDGKSDLVLTDYDHPSVIVFLGNGDGTFQSPSSSPTSSPPIQSLVGDFNEDGIPDVVIGMTTSQRVELLPGKGDGTFGAPILLLNVNPSSIVSGDFNGDGYADLIVINYSGLAGQNVAYSVLLGTGNGGFSTTTYSYSFANPNAMPLVVADFNGDSKADIAFASSNTVSIMLGKGDGTFSAPVGREVPAYITGLSSTDVNADGNIDLVVSTESAVSFNNATNFVVLLGDGAGSLSQASYYNGSSDGGALTVGDFNSDGRPDVVKFDSASQQLVVYDGVPPSDLTLTITHAATFQQGLKSASYTIVVQNLGPAASGGQVTVMDLLPLGMTYAGAGGPGWSCSIYSGASIRCVRLDPLASGASYDPITLLVNVSVTAPPTATDLAMISNASMSDPNPSNDLARDDTVILQTSNNSCNYSLDVAGERFTASGGNAQINIKAPSGCAWSISDVPLWVIFGGYPAGNGNGTLTFAVAQNFGPDRIIGITVAGIFFKIEQLAPSSITGLQFVGGMPHLAAEENWITSFTLVNKSQTATQARLTLFGNPSGILALPVVFPQEPPAMLPLIAASIDRTLSPNASFIVSTAGPQNPPVLQGSARLSATGGADGFAIFHLIPGAQEAVVPLETRNASSYLLAFDNTNGVVMGVAIASALGQATGVNVVIRDDAGAQIALDAYSFPANGHVSFVLPMQYPVTANKRGTIEFDTSVGGQISVLGIRTTPLGTSNTLTTIPALANVGTNGGSIAHIATGNGWQTTFVLVNTGASSAQAHLKFFSDSGGPLSLPLSFPQSGGGAPTTAVALDRTLAAGASLIVQSTAPLSNLTPTTGSAQLTTDGNIGGFVIFRFNPNGQEAVVPLESRNATGYVLAFDNTAGTATGVAINAVSAGAANIPVIVRDDTGAQIATDTLNLAANGHLAFTLAVDKYPGTANIRGTVEFDTPAGAQIGALGIRIPVAHTFTTLPALAK